MMNILIGMVGISLMFTLAWSFKEGLVKAESHSEHIFESCERVEYGVKRCQNKEVVCYINEGFRHSSMQCDFKKED